MIQVREYATLTADSEADPSINVGRVSGATFEWLINLHNQWEQDSKLIIRNGKKYLKLGSYVGYLQSPSGEGIEILPKTEFASPEKPEPLRKLLQDMLRCSASLDGREGDSADLTRSELPIHEWIIAQFLNQLTTLVKRGLRFDYETIEEESRFIRGQLDVGKQSRQSPARATWFNIRHDVFSPNRTENRLLRTALDYVLKLTKNAQNWRVANTLSHQLSVIEPFRKPLPQISQWQNTKLMQPYRAIKPWCVLVLERLNPNFQHGLHSGIAMLFPMEQLFENYVAHHVKKQMRSGASLTSQAASQWLIKHSPDGGPEKSWFQLKPDLLVTYLSRKTVMDAKWKLLDSTQNTSAEKYGIKQADLYQLFAYGHKYQNGYGHMLLIYPKHAAFQEPLPTLSFSEDLHLWCVPFDMYEKQLVVGEWVRFFPALRRDLPLEPGDDLHKTLKSIEDVSKALGGSRASDLAQRLHKHLGLAGELTLVTEDMIHQTSGDQFNDWSDRKQVLGFEYAVTDPATGQNVGTGMLLLPFTTKQLLHKLKSLLKRYQRQVSGAVPKNLDSVMARVEERLRLAIVTKESKP
ncbi:McrC family protein [Marinobacter salarius]|uniref:McrC family protein n=1 Tax=Marinobacter salarius TaxID=1420917 RepID=UPI003D9C0E04